MCGDVGYGCEGGATKINNFFIVCLFSIDLKCEDCSYNHHRKLNKIIDQFL